MKHYIYAISIAITIFILLSFDYFVKHTAQKAVTDNEGKINKIIQHKLDPDIIVFGSSVAQFHVNPVLMEKQTNKDVFNLGLAGTTFIQYRGLLNEFLNYSQKCKYIIMVLLPIEFSNRNIIYKAHTFWANIDNKNIYNSLYDINPPLLFKMKYIPFYKLTVYNKSFYEIVINNLSSHKNQNTDLLKGFKPQNESWGNLADGQTNINQDNRNNTALEKNQSDYKTINTTYIHEIENYIRLFNKRGGKFIFVIPPIYYEYTKKENRDINPTAVKNIINTAMQLVKINPEMNFTLDYSSDSISMQKNMFYNYTHLTSDGADMFTQKISTDLLKLNLFE